MIIDAASIRRRSLTLTIACTLALGIAGCGDDDTTVGPAEETIAPVIPEPTSPENLVEAIAVIYNDTVRDATERRMAYQSLFPPPHHPTLSFIFRLLPDDIIIGLPESWGRDHEIAIHERMFAAQDAREIFELSLSIEYDPPEALEFPEPGQEAWQVIAAIDCDLRLLFTADDGLAVTGAREEFIAAPADDRWYIVEWNELPRAGGVVPGGGASGYASWGSIKAMFE